MPPQGGAGGYSYYEIEKVVRAILRSHNVVGNRCRAVLPEVDFLSGLSFDEFENQRSLGSPVARTFMRVGIGT